MMINIMNLKVVSPSESYDFYIDRRSPVGNPFPLKQEADRKKVCSAYEEYFNLKVGFDSTEFVGYLNIILKALELYGVVRLFCWCYPKQCHGETIKRWLEREFEKSGEVEDGIDSKDKTE